jgi:hypothetical protein
MLAVAIPLGMNLAPEAPVTGCLCLAILWSRILPRLLLLLRRLLLLLLRLCWQVLMKLLLLWQACWRLLWWWWWRKQGEACWRGRCRQR